MLQISFDTRARNLRLSTSQKERKASNSTRDQSSSEGRVSIRCTCWRTLKTGVSKAHYAARLSYEDTSKNYEHFTLAEDARCHGHHAAIDT